MTIAQQSRDLYKSEQYSIAEIAKMLNTHYSAVSAACKGLKTEPIIQNVSVLESPLDINKLKIVKQTQSVAKLRMLLYIHSIEQIKQIFADNANCSISFDKGVYIIQIITHEVTQRCFRVIYGITFEVMELLYHLTEKVNCEIQFDRHIYKIQL